MINPKDFAQGVVDQFNAEDRLWKGQISAVRGYVPKLELLDLAAPLAFVAPKSQSLDISDESGWERQIVVDIGILKKLPQRALKTGLEDNADLDALLDLCGDVVDYFTADGYEGPDGFQCHGLDHDPIYDPELLQMRRTFLCVLSVHFFGITTEELA